MASKEFLGLLKGFLGADGWMDKNSPCVPQDFVPFRVAALLPLKFTLKMLKQGKGIADHVLPLGDLLIRLMLRQALTECTVRFVQKLHGLEDDF